MCLLSKPSRLLLLVSVVMSTLISACGNPAETRIVDTRIVFESDRDGNSEIYVINADGSGEMRLTQGGGTDPSWSPDKKQIAFACPGGFCIMNMDGSIQTRVTDLPPKSWEPTWSGDGQWIAFTSNYEIYKIKVDGTGLTNLTNNSAADYHPAFSPDGTRIAFVSEREAGKVELYVMNADGSQPKRLTATGFATFPEWSPDSKRLTYFGMCNANSGVICILNADGSGQIQALNLNDTKLKADTAWSPDGTKIAFGSKRDDNQEIYITNLDGTEVTRLTQDHAHDRYPDW